MKKIIYSKGGILFLVGDITMLIFLFIKIEQSILSGGIIPIFMDASVLLFVLPGLYLIGKQLKESKPKLSKFLCIMAIIYTVVTLFSLTLDIIYF